MALHRSNLFAAAIAFCLLSSWLSSADAHAALESPVSRNVAWFSASGPGASMGLWYSTAGNGLGPRPFRPVGQPGVCGDPTQEVSPVTTIVNWKGPVTNYQSGSVVTFRVKMQVNHGGRIAYRLCDRSTSLDQNCFNSRVLLRDDNNRPFWYITQGSFGTISTFEMKYRLPSGFSCPNGCVLQMEYFTYNSCIESCPANECGTAYAAGSNPITGQAGPLATCYTAGAPPPEIFRNCADITIGGNTTPTPVPPTPSPSPRPPSPTPPTGSDPCPGIAPGPSRAACFCSKRASGKYQDIFNGCSGGFWCYGGGSQYIQCPSGLRYSTVLNGVCDWPNNVICDGSRVAPASAGTRPSRRVRVPCGGRVVPCLPETLGEHLANVSAVPAQTAAQGAAQLTATLAAQSAGTDAGVGAVTAAASDVSGGVAAAAVADDAAAAAAASDPVKTGSEVVAIPAAGDAAAAESG